MSFLQKIKSRLCALFHKSRLDEQMADEMRLHIEMQTEENIESGMKPDEARYAALRQFGWVESVKEMCREQRRGSWVESLVQDIRHSLRMLCRNPAFTLVTVCTLALGIGANTAIFSLMDAVLLKMLPVTNPEELVVLTHAGGDRSGNGFPYPVFERLRNRNASFSELVAFSTWPEVMLTLHGKAESLPGGVLLASANYFSGLGVKPFLGRLVSTEDKREAVAVLSYGFWQRRFGSDPSIIGRTIVLNETVFTVIGITPPEFFGMRVGRSDAVTIPMTMLPQMMPAATFLRDPANWSVELIGRLKPNLRESEARTALRPLFQQIEMEIEGGNPGPERLKIIRDRRIELSPASKGISALRAQFSEPLRILMVVVSLVLLIACANVANLLLSRATIRRREIAVRLALGAGRMRVVRQLLTESVLLGLLGGLAGLIVARWASTLAVSLIPGGSSAISLKIALDARVLGFTAIVSMLTGIVFGLIPALQVTGVILAPTLKEGGQSVGQNRRASSLGNILVAGQIALSLLLLIVASLFVRTFVNLQSLNPGFSSQNVLLFSLDTRMNRLSEDQAFALFKRLLERLQQVPGVICATVSRDGNFGGGGRTKTDINVEGFSGNGGNDTFVFDVPAGPRFFETFGTPLLMGRDFTLLDDQSAPKVAILSQAAAHRFFGERNPLGRHIGIGEEKLTVIGVAQDAKLNDLREEAPRVMYRSFLQAGPPRRMTFGLRAAIPPKDLIATVRRELNSFDRDLPLFGFGSLHDMVKRAAAQERFFAVLSSLFGLLALALAAVGLYGVVSYSVSRRTREIGVRMALGACDRTVLRLVIVQGMRVVIIGLAAGAFAALALTRLIAAQLYGVTPADPAVFIIVSSLLMLIAIAACYLPARRAAKLDPMTALRCD